ncbi:MAG: hypothetical protein BroJett040_23220 [Oligoflexia bacterium]|nr:MAG: hypothetical protein BroJett040_23220 [Oligoflexia bacterium]
MPKSMLQKQLEESHFEHGIAYVENESHGLKKLHTNELSHLNQILTGSKGDTASDPWRFEAAAVTLPTGHTQHFNVVSNPINRAREILGFAQIMEGNGEIIAGAQYLYTTLVKEHLFKDANRRTAALATYWILLSHDYEVDPHVLIKLKVGNLHDPKEYADFIQRLEALIHKIQS